jgi:N-acetylglucosamine-6-phosphate deacetylase
MLTKILNGNVLAPQGLQKNVAIFFCDGKIIDVTDKNFELPNDENISAEVIDAKGAYVIPGGIELHAHGGGGRDFMEGSEEAFRTAVNTHLRYGTTAIFPTLSASSTEMILDAAATTERLMAEGDSPIMGLHLEGPYFNLDMAGAQMPEYVRIPEKDEYASILEQTSCIKRWDAAPELPNAMDFARYITSQGVLASVGHTAADFDTISAARNAGYSHATHLYNAMTGVHKRGEYKCEGTIESLLYYDNFTVELIADGIHVPPAILRYVHKIKGTERMCLITDALAVMAADNASAFDPRVIIEDGVCKLSDRSALAGSIATMDRLIRTAVTQAEIPFVDVVRMTSETPARIMGIYDRKGSLERGKDADIVLMDSSLELCGVWSMGKLVEGTSRL